jgi:protein gp37
MGELSKIEWTDHTFNAWRGCTKVSPGCHACYAETMSHRNPGVLGEWGPNGKRVVAAESYWRQPLKWDRDAKAAGERRRVFCASLSDVFEDREDLLEPRDRLFDLIGETPNLDWLLLTKRPENLARFLPWCHDHAGQYRDRYWPNVWIGTSVEDQQRANERIPRLVDIPAAVHFLSVEPLLGPADFSRCWYTSDGEHEPAYVGIHWVIVGGESGPRARPMHPDWARLIRDQCQAAGVPFFFKQWGEWAPSDDDTPRGVPEIYLDRSGIVTPTASPYEPGCPCDHMPGEASLVRVGKARAGRLLDDREWSEMPAVAGIGGAAC